MFYLLGAGGLAAAVFTFLIPESSIDHDRARQLNTDVKTEDDNAHDDDDDDDEEADDLAIAAFAKNFVSGEFGGRSSCLLQSGRDVSSKSTFFHTGSTSFVILNPYSSSLKLSSGRLDLSGKSNNLVDCPNETVSTEDGKAKPSRYRDLLKSPQIIGFAIVTFFYHLINAGMTPLLAQHLAISSSDRASLALTSSLLLLSYLFQAVSFLFFLI